VLKATIKGVLAHKLRLVLTALAIVIGVAFVSGTYILTDTINRSFDELFQTVNRGVAVTVQAVPRFESNGFGGQTAGPAERVPNSIVDLVRGVPGVRTAEGTLNGYSQIVVNGRAITTGGAPTLGASTVSDPQLSGAKLRAGRLPERQGEIAVDAATASEHDLRLGQHVTVLLQGPSMQATIVGIFGFGTADNLGGATLVGFDPQTAQSALNGGGKWDTIVVAAENGVSPTELKSRISKVLPAGVEAKTGQQAAADDANQIKQALSFFNVALLVFAGIALFVGAFTIFNTFQILVTQRTRELALLRALGASAAQVLRSVVTEAFLLGAVSSAIGLAAGFLIAKGLQAVLGAFGIDLPTTSTQVLPRTIIAAFAVGIVTTVIASVFPARRASRIAPIAALRDAQPAAYLRSRGRTIAGTLVTVAGAGVLLYGLLGGPSNAASFVGLGAAAVFQGVALLSPLIAGPVARALGAAPRALFGVTAKLGRENAMRNPKRTASTAAALMIGLGLIGFVSIFGASLKASSTKILEDTLKADYIVTDTSFQGFSQDVAKQMRSEPEFASVTEFRQGLFGVQGGAQQVQGVDPGTLLDVVSVDFKAGSASALGTADSLLVSESAADQHHWRVGDTVPVEYARTGPRRAPIVGIYESNPLLNDYVVSLSTFDANFTQQLDSIVLAKAGPGVSQADAKRAAAAVTKQFPNVKLEDQAQFRQSQAKLIDQILGLVTALLGLALAVAVVGIWNTLALSVYERTHEIGLLRAVGMARRQVRAMIRWEAMLVAVFGALLGIAVGIFFGWAMVHALSGIGISVLSIPAVQLAIYVVIAGVLGVVAALVPAWQAGRLNVLRAIATE
jgi:putative ABC transport system permease protein